MEDPMIRSAIEYVKTIFQADYSGHDISHTLRVYQTACRLAEAEQADLRIVQLAALLHDVDDRKLSPETHEHKDRAVAFMKSQNLGGDVIQQVCRIISEVSYAGRDSVVPSSIDGLDLICSNINLVGAEVELMGMRDRERVLSRVLEPMREKYDYILIDCSPSLGIITVNALTAADSVIIPVQSEYFALEGISQLLNTIRIIKSRLRPALEIEGFLLTMYDARLRLANQIFE